MLCPPRPLVLLSILLGCASDAEESCVTDRVITANRISLNRIALNKLAANGLLSEALPATRLAASTLVDILGSEALEDPLVQSVIEYAVGCALAPGQSLTIPHGDTTATYQGSLGLAPQWASPDGTCDAGCRGWVSACLIARSNFLGESQPISLLGDHPGLAPSEFESSSFALEEATYFGELFGADREMYACIPAGADAPERTCGGDPSTCAIAVLGPCDAVCDAHGCRGANGKLYPQTITVNLNEHADCR